MTVNDFLERCWVNKLDLRVLTDVPWQIIVTKGPVDKATKALEILRNNRDLEADIILELAKQDKSGYLMDLIIERTAIRGAYGLPSDVHSAVLANMALGYDK
ncbi:MAG: hypothetical protein IJ667_02925 [Synergistaceae bacterium]|nr:hypothetical protein [Synergistaceae bacterium]